MPRKWQDIISKWDAWANSIEVARVGLDKRHGELNELVAKADYKWHHKEKETEIAFEIELNPEAKILWEVHTELRKIASEFVSHEMGLNPSSTIHRVFAHFWIESAFREVKQPPQFQPDVSARKTQPFNLEQRADRDGKIVNTLKWYPELVSPIDVCRLVLRASLFTNYDALIRKAKGGQPRKSRELTIYPEAITCAILKDKQGLSYKEIASHFGWATQKDSYENVSTSNTVANRVKLGRKVLQQHYERNH